MRIATFFAVMLACMVFTANGTTVSAKTINPNETENPTILAKTSTLDDLLFIFEPKETTETTEEEEEPEVVVHTVSGDETLYDIAEHYDTTWRRLFYKNTDIADPDMIKVGQEITIPLADEKLAERSLPEPPAPAPEPEPQAEQAAPAPRQEYVAAAPVQRGSSSGNTYDYGYCTWYVKERRPDLPNNLGNADTWVSRARAQGIPTGSTPRVGAVGQRNMHVVYVERVNNDGTIFISEMNREGWNVRSTRTVPASYFTYIY